MAQYRNFNSLDEAYEFLADLGANRRLLQHVRLVGEAAELLIELLNQTGLTFNRELVRLGVAFHDVGKILHPEEQHQSGNQHEASGQGLLISHGVSPEIARCCQSHGQWQIMECSLEELLVALSDKLWKGKREEKLEKKVIEEVAERLRVDFWTVAMDLDSGFEMIASQGTERLMRTSGDV